MLLKRNFYSRHTIQVAKDLLGCFLVREYRGKIIKAMITETEAYRGEYDLGSHASRGRTKRTKIMYGHPGYAYIYMIYGMYFMLNVVTEKKEFPAAVLIRGVDAGTGFKPVQKNRSGLKPAPTRILYGPGKLTKFLHINKSLNGHDLTRGEKIWIEGRDALQCVSTKRRLKMIKSPRVGIDYARHCKGWKWNFRLEAKK